MAETTYKKGELLLDETVVVEAGGSYNFGLFQTQRVLTEETVIIIFNNVEYICEAIHIGEASVAYGGVENGMPGLTNYPFSICNDDVSSSQIIIITESPGTYTIKMYTAIPDSDSDSSSEPITIRSYIDKNLTSLNWNILPQIFESEGVELTEEIERYLRETPKNTNWNMMQTIINSNEDRMEIWFSSDAYVDNDGGRIFVLLNPDYTEHMTELLINAENYRIYLNNEELLTFRRTTETFVGWADGDGLENITKYFTVRSDSHGDIAAGITFMDSSIAPTSVEIAVKQK